MAVPRHISRLVEPPLSQISGKIEGGERRLIDVLDAGLPSQWEFYIQPHLNGLRPDLVLLNPAVGIAVYEVKDWNLDAMHYYCEDGPAGVRLMARDASERAFCIEDRNPISKILLYQDEINSLYCPRLDSQHGIAVISAGIVFPRATRARVLKLLDPLRARYPGMAKHAQRFPIVGADDLDAGNIRHILPDSGWPSSKYMSDAVAEDLRGWLREPDFSREQRHPLPIDDSRQRELITTRTDKGYRRVKGPAGSGKTFVLAARAATVAAESKRVLVLTFNITLMNYIRDLVVRHPPGGRQSLKEIDILNFHTWCKRVCTAAGMTEEYTALWAAIRAGADEEREDREQLSEVLNERLAELVSRALKTSEGPTRYDAIMVDEGQDFRLSWWKALRLALKPGGEMLLVADKTQDLYGTASAWTEQAMNGAGFAGDWFKLETSYRIPAPLVALVKRFADEFMAGREIDVPVAGHGNNQLELADLKTELRWVQLSPSDSICDACVEEVGEMMQSLTTTTAVADIVLLLPNQNLGLAVCQALLEKNLRVHHTFDTDKRASRKKKLAFFKGDARVKATTLHSFKGWEARHLIVVVDTIHQPDSAALLYTAMTRLRRDSDGSCLTVISACPELREFGLSWPSFGFSV